MEGQDAIAVGAGLAPEHPAYEPFLPVSLDSSGVDSPSGSSALPFVCLAKTTLPS